MWCATCESIRQDHGICNICASPLTSRQSPNSSGLRNHTQETTSETGNMTRRLGPAHDPRVTDILRQEQQRHTRIQTLINSIADRNETMDREEAIAIAATMNEDEEWEQPPAEAFDLDGGDPHSQSIPASRKYVQSISRTVLDERSPLLAMYKTTVRLTPPSSVSIATCEFSSSAANINLKSLNDIRADATPGEFGKNPPYSVEGKIVLSDLASRKDGRLKNFHEFDSNQEQGYLTSSESRRSTIAYCDRGGGTFVAKAHAAQIAGASAVIIGNTGSIWPFIMKDSLHQAERLGLKIPVVMVKQSDSFLFKNMVRDFVDDAVTCTIECELANANDKDEKGVCAVCREGFKVGEIVLILPACIHCFHEVCALTWLENHNTCPFCRRELPTDDPQYEQRRLAGSTQNSTSLARQRDDYDRLLG